MPKIDIDWKFNIGSLLNAVLLLAAIVGGAFAYFADQRAESQMVRQLKDRVQFLQATDQQISAKITEAQERTTNRLTTLEAQNVFIIRSLDRLESALRDRKL